MNDTRTALPLPFTNTYPFKCHTLICNDSLKFQAVIDSLYCISVELNPLPDVYLMYLMFWKLTVLLYSRDQNLLTTNNSLYNCVY